MTEPCILVLGAGPAGAATAMGLQRLGYRVQVVSDWRRFDAVEGVSQRVLEGLRHAGLGKALEQAAMPSRRRVEWNGQRQWLNQECLLDRSCFDQALREDLRNAGVEVIEARVADLSSRTDGHQVQLHDGRLLTAGFLVEARGRQAPLTASRLRGPESVSLLNLWREQPGEPLSAVESLADGWAWMARLADGRCYWQISLDSSAGALPGKAQLAEYCAQRRRQSALVAEMFGAAATQAVEVYARSSTAILAGRCAGDNWLRVGDAAMAVDPLSGNGIFQSLSSALQAPAVINTLLRRPRHKALALRFHQERIEQLFLRFARIGRDFYAQERGKVGQAFWDKRQSWPDAQPLHLAADYRQLRVERRPVVSDGFIDEAEVVVSADQPLGIWHLQGVPLAPVVSGLRSGQGLEQLLGARPAAEQAMLRNWLAAQGYQG
ncbi:NAD(P)/FAD-dependent oxidoreductase [Pseudomonas sp. DG56-2]|uniref:flavin-dependent monooxygenase QhpG n=1 Tax=Pseudomonas sp. DG56-2 TaxID=2320270 RepID=UPI0010A62B9E|nr:FAD-dependent monooxygenase [Pseudomonas sp. DG56-2]